MDAEKEIRDEFARIGYPLAEKTGFTYGWVALSQYGYPLANGFETREAAEAYTISHYKERMHLIMQFREI